jgi:aryl-alcohol dehydrogenase-like predicted oxidoreductase
VESSLSNLNTGYIDLYQSHGWDAGTPLEETLRTYSDLVRSGKVRYIGVSNYSGWQFQKALDYSRFMGLEKYITYQGQYSLLCRNAELVRHFFQFILVFNLLTAACRKSSPPLKVNELAICLGLL